MSNHDNNTTPASLKTERSDPEIKRTSKLLSLLLRHRPETIDLELDRHGWADIDGLIRQANRHDARRNIDRALIETVVATSDKKRFAISDDGRRIRANQGHSIDIDLELASVTPPAELFHGTATRFLDSIMEAGLTSQSRQHVHLSAETETAVNVGSRHGKPIVLVVDAVAMVAAGHEFYVSANGVWLTNTVPPAFLRVGS